MPSVIGDPCHVTDDAMPSATLLRHRTRGARMRNLGRASESSNDPALRDLEHFAGHERLA